MVNINSKTKLVGLLGYPLDHTLSPAIHNAAFEEKRINNVYLPIEVKPDNFGHVIKTISCMNFIGFNITIPFKVEVMKYLDAIDETAKCIGAVNTVVVRDGKLIGYNTDGTGFLKSFEEASNSTIAEKKVLVLGSGGASKAICMTLALNKVGKLYICNRTHEKALTLANSINKKVSAISSAIPMEYNAINETIKKVDLLINTTSLGMFPRTDEMPIDGSLLNKGLIVCDIVYNPRKTKLILEAERLGCKTVPGLGMLVYQGAEAFEIWTGTKAPVKLMYSVVNEALERNGFKRIEKPDKPEF